MFRAILFTFVVSLTISTPSKAEIKEVTLLHTNDIDSVYEPLEAAWRDYID